MLRVAVLSLLVRCSELLLAEALEQESKRCIGGEGADCAKKAFLCGEEERVDASCLLQYGLSLARRPGDRSPQKADAGSQLAKLRRRRREVLLLLGRADSDEASSASKDEEQVLEQEVAELEARLASLKSRRGEAVARHGHPVAQALASASQALPQASPAHAAPAATAEARPMPRGLDDIPETAAQMAQEAAHLAQELGHEVSKTIQENIAPVVSEKASQAAKTFKEDIAPAVSEKASQVSAAASAAAHEGAHAVQNWLEETAPARREALEPAQAHISSLWDSVRSGTQRLQAEYRQSETVENATARIGTVAASAAATASSIFARAAAAWNTGPEEHMPQAEAQEAADIETSEEESADDDDDEQFWVESPE